MGKTFLDLDTVFRVPTKILRTTPASLAGGVVSCFGLHIDLSNRNVVGPFLFGALGPVLECLSFLLRRGFTFGVTKKQICRRCDGAT